MNDLARIADALERIAQCLEIETQIEMDRQRDTGGRTYDGHLTDHMTARRAEQYTTFARQFAKAVKTAQPAPERSNGRS